MRPVSNGRPGTAVIPTGWAASLRPAAVGTMTATVSVRHKGSTTVFDGTQTVTTPLPSYAADVPARVLAVTTKEHTVVAAGDPVHVRGYLVTVPVAFDNADAAGGVAEEDLVTVTACDDWALVGKTLRVDDLIRGSDVVERDLFCTLND